MKRRLTDIGVENLTAKAGERVELFDTLMPGLCIRVGTNGRKSWSLQYRVAGRGPSGNRGQLKRLTLGQYPLVSLAAAREKAKAAYDLAERGIDPAEKKKSDLDERNRLLVENLLPEYFERHCRPNLRGGKAVESLLRRKVLPHWKGRPLNAIARIDCIRLLDLTVDNDGAAQGTEVRRHLSGFLSWAANRGYIQSNPLAGARLPELTPKSRSRVLDEREMQAVWGAVLSLEQPYRAYVQLLFLTAGRRTEIANLRTSWFGVVEGEEVIDIPGAYTKTGEPHVLPITTAIRSVLDSCPIMLRGDCVFSTTQGEKPISGFSKI
ncbi:MAG: integrase family protein, partial [Rhizobiaceae bacterium]|nr:integrase family protein [Rhizobiaceae bacterium]